MKFYDMQHKVIVLVCTSPLFTLRGVNFEQIVDNAEPGLGFGTQGLGLGFDELGFVNLGLGVGLVNMIVYLVAITSQQTEISE